MNKIIKFEPDKYHKLSKEEIEFLNMFRSLDEKGKQYIKQAMNVTVNTYKVK